MEVPDRDLLLALTGTGGERLRILEAEYSVVVGTRGNRIHVQGDAGRVSQAERAIAELLEVFAGGSYLSDIEMRRALTTLRDRPELKLRALFNEPILASSSRRIIAPKSLTQQLYVQAISDFDIVFGVGPAGTGKTYLAMAMAVRALLEKKVKRIVLTRPAVEAGEKLGFLPGDLAEKVNPYLRPLYDALNDMMDFDKAQALIQRGTIEVAPLAFMRGRTLANSFVILDEAQNTTIEQMKMLLTRIGFDSKVVVTGDVTQVDLPDGRRSGLRDALGLLTDVEGIKQIHFSDADVVRHPLVQKIVRAYEARDTAREVAATRAATKRAE